LTADPGQIPLVFLVIRISDCLEEFSIATAAADIFWGTRVRSVAAVGQHRGYFFTVAMSQW
jgi:uncharacterized membrane protein